MTTPSGPRLHPTGRLVPAELDEAMVAAVVQDFYAKARADEIIGPVFQPRHPRGAVAAPHCHHHRFWSSMLLGTGRYMGRPMPKHLAIPELTEAHFARWLRLFRETGEAHCPPDIAALFTDRAQRIAYNFRLRIAQFRGERHASGQTATSG